MTPLIFRLAATKPLRISERVGPAFDNRLAEVRGKFAAWKGQADPIAFQNTWCRLSATKSRPSHNRSATGSLSAAMPLPLRKFIGISPAYGVGR